MKMTAINYWEILNFACVSSEVKAFAHIFMFELF